MYAALGVLSAGLDVLVDTAKWVNCGRTCVRKSIMHAHLPVPANRASPYVKMQVMVDGRLGRCGGAWLRLQGRAGKQGVLCQLPRCFLCLQGKQQGGAPGPQAKGTCFPQQLWKRALAQSNAKKNRCITNCMWMLCRQGMHTTMH